MTKICVFSDSHGKTADMERVVRAEKPDIVLHLGDMTEDCDALRRGFPELQIANVRGNCDYYSASPELMKLNIEGRKIFAAHGHRYNVKNSYNAICYAAMEAEADIVLFGHTHIPYRDRTLCMEIMNPGSIGRGIEPSYGVIELDEDKLFMEIRYV